MNFDPLFSAAQPIPIHAILALFAVVIGGLQFILHKGTFLHRTVGYIWVVSMFIVATSSFFINEFRWVGPFGPIHLLSCLVLFSLWRGVSYARCKNISGHKRAMVQLYFLSLLLAGAFTFLPGRIMHAVLFG
ncbi:MAG: DUF2306 domain-containing protein [Pseudoruegeria sp.]